MKPVASSVRCWLTGAMRERGRRATAFLGRRHFDDPFLLDAVFGGLSP